MAQDTAVQMHSVYRIWFTWVDPLITWMTVVLALVNPDLVMDSALPDGVSLRNPDNDFLLQQIAALFAFMGVITTFLLRASADIKVWNIVQAGILLVDVALLVILYITLGHHDRLDPATWRASDWANVLITVWVALLRSLFLMGIGVKTVKGKTA
ncbi:hypothetical protein GQ53DRAFT_350775 [Thozetella sp. PMI_491]|nr:hypothetical protein GQ53DRAFT_350775 [Thozetella sp. PMI_491]